MTSTASRCRGTLQRHNAWRSLVSTVSKQKPLWGETEPRFGPCNRSWWFKPGREWLSYWIWSKGTEGRELKWGSVAERQNGNMADITVYGYEKRRNGRKREQEKGWRGKDNGREGTFRGGEKNIWKGKGLKKNSIWTLSRTKVVKSEIKVGDNRNVQISHWDGWKWKKDGMVTGVRMTHICLSLQPKSEMNCFPETLDGMIFAAPAWCSVFNDLTLGSWVKKKKKLL